MGFIMDMLLSQAEKLFVKDTPPVSVQQPVSKPEKKPLRSPDEMIELLNHSKVFTFENIAGKGIVLTKCKKEYNIHSLTIPDVVERIGSGAFEECHFLQSITIPDSVTVIENNAFRNCKYLEKIRFSGALKRIGSNAFEGCAVTEAVLPEGLYELGSRAFFDCRSLRSVRLPESLCSFQNGVFYGCVSLEDITLPMNMRGTTCNLFAHCKSLKSFYVPDGIREIGNWSFEYCSGLSDVYIPSSVKKLCNRAFYYCTSLESVNIPDSVEEIEAAGVFSCCTSLSRVRLPIGVRFIPFSDKESDRVFHNCPQLHTIVLGSHTFEVDEPPDDKALLVLHAELAAAGNPTARRYVLAYLGDILSAVTDRGDIQCLERLLSCGILTKDTVSPGDMDKALDHAADTGKSEIYVMLLQFRRDKLGFDGTGDRFRL